MFFFLNLCPSSWKSVLRYCDPQINSYPMLVGINYIYNYISIYEYIYSRKIGQNAFELVSNKFLVSIRGHDCRNLFNFCFYLIFKQEFGGYLRKRDQILVPNANGGHCG